MDSHKRSIYKTISWRVLATIITIGILGLVMDDWSMASGVGVGINIAKALTYYIHERVWNRFKWGRV